jgi:hypothetical protein
VLPFHGADFGDLVKVTVYVTSFDRFEELSALREQLFSDSPPASAIVQVGRLVQPGLLIEVRRSRPSRGTSLVRPRPNTARPRVSSPPSTTGSWPWPRKYGQPNWTGLKPFPESQPAPDRHAREQLRWIAARFADAGSPGALVLKCRDA